MLNDLEGFKRIYIAPGYTDLRKGIDSLAALIKFSFGLDPYERNTLFMFCGKKSTRIKCLLWEGDGWLLLYKRLESGAFRWPRNGSEALEITDEQFRLLMRGLEVIARHPITMLSDPPKAM